MNIGHEDRDDVSHYLLYVCDPAGELVELGDHVFIMIYHKLSIAICPVILWDWG